ncbi:MAG TPA: DUF1800 domain-containing protein [Acidobacteriaceae bacterium]|jgi:uncharacterized protein (DUF1800 family)
MSRFLIAVLLFGEAVALAGAQHKPASPKPASPIAVPSDGTDSAAPPDAAQAKAASTFAKSRTPAARAAKSAAPKALTPLSPRERVVQLLDRFTYGPRPGDVDRVLAMGGDQWVEQQLNPDSVPDPVLNHRLADYFTLGMNPQQVITFFPDRAQVYAVAEGRVPYPADPLQNAVYEVQVFKWDKEKDAKRPDGSGQPRPEPTDAEKAEAKKRDQATAARIAGELFALPKQQRMNALIAMPVEDRIAFTGNGNLANEQRAQLLAGFTPRERETFQAMAGQVSSSGNIANELAQAHILRDVLTERQLQAVMTDFWFNHFNIFIGKDSDQWYAPTYERDSIRKHALGSFRDLLLATAQSPAMMVYLDNYLSIGPDSLANGVDPRNPNAKKGNRGLNENYGREVMELHTVGVNGGYTQADVTALSAILTGWGVDQPNQGGPFLFDPRRHEPGPKVWLGYQIEDDGRVSAKDVKAPVGQTFGASSMIATQDSVKQGITALNILAASPQTAHFISTLLAQYFVADTPPPALVDRLTKTYLASNGDIKTILRALIASPEFNSRQYFHNKVKTPVEFIASAFRATATDPQNAGALANTIRTMGMPMYYALPPTGYYLTADQWMNSSALIDRLNFSYQLTNGKFANQKFDAPRLLAMGLMSTSAAAGMEAQPRLLGVARSSTSNGPDAPVASTGPRMAMHVLEATMIGAPVSAKTNDLIGQQLAQQPPTASPTDTLNLLTALVMGSPEFQLR